MDIYELTRSLRSSEDLISTLLKHKQEGVGILTKSTPESLIDLCVRLECIIEVSKKLKELVNEENIHIYKEALNEL